MRRPEIVAAIRESIEDEFDDGAAEAFDLDDLDNVARMLQNECNPGDVEEVRDIVRSAYKAAPDRELDMLQDGEMNSPMGWLYNKLQEQARFR